MLVDLYLSLGSNMGDRAANIENAVSLLNIELKTSYKAISSFLETEPWGFESEQKFLNAAVHYELQLKEGYNPEAEALMILEISSGLNSIVSPTFVMIFGLLIECYTAAVFRLAARLSRRCFTVPSS